MKKRLIFAFILITAIVISGCHSTGSKEPSDKSGPVVDIVDLTKTENVNAGAAPEPFYFEDGVVYFFNMTKSGSIIVHYKDGSQENIGTALREGRASIADLDRFGISYSTRSAAESDYTTWWENPDGAGIEQPERETN